MNLDKFFSGSMIAKSKGRLIGLCPLFLLLFMVFSQSAYAAISWVTGNGRSCQQVCAGKRAVSSGTHPSSRHQFYVCRANTKNDGYRPGFNLKPSWDKTCTVPIGTGLVSAHRYQCLCESGSSSTYNKPYRFPKKQANRYTPNKSNTSIAIALSNSGFTINWGPGSARTLGRQAKAQCDQNYSFGKNNCKIKLQRQNTCASLVSVKRGRGYTYAYSYNRSKYVAQKNALAACKKRAGGRNCSVEASKCSWDPH